MNSTRASWRRRSYQSLENSVDRNGLSTVEVALPFQTSKIDNALFEPPSFLHYFQVLLRRLKRVGSTNDPDLLETDEPLGDRETEWMILTIRTAKTRPMILLQYRHISYKALPGQEE